MKSWNNLWDEFISDKNIKKAINDASKGKRKRKYVKHILSNLNESVSIFKDYALNFRNDPHVPITIYDGIERKQRTIIVPSFRELVIQHMLVNVLKPMFLQGLYEYSYGSIPGRGAHDAKKVMEKWITKDSKNFKYILKLDIKKYFESISHVDIKIELAKVIKDKRILYLLCTIIDSSEKGLPLGFYTSQWLSMWYLKKLDHYIKEKCYSPHYMRYADDLVITGSNKRKLKETYEKIVLFLKFRRLELNKRSQLFKFVREINNKKYGRDLDFMGFRFFRNRTILRRHIYYKMCRKVKRIYKKEKITIYDIRQMMSYLGYIKSSHVYSSYIKYIKPYFNFRKAKRKISNYDKRRNKLYVENCSIYSKAA